MTPPRTVSIALLLTLGCAASPVAPIDPGGDDQPDGSPGGKGGTPPARGGGGGTSRGGTAGVAAGGTGGENAGGVPASGGGPSLDAAANEPDASPGADAPPGPVDAPPFPPTGGFD